MTKQAKLSRQPIAMSTYMDVQSVYQLPGGIAMGAALNVVQQAYEAFGRPGYSGAFEFGSRPG